MAGPGVTRTPRRRLRPGGERPVGGLALPLSLACAALVGTATYAPSAVAQTLPTPAARIEFVDPTPDAGVAITGRETVRASVRTLGLVRNLVVTVRSDDPSIPPFEAKAEQGVPLPNEATVELEWDARRLSHNGVYRFDASAQVCSTECTLIHAERTGIVVSVPPDDPERVTAEYRDAVPVVTWRAGSEADLLGYHVFRYTGTWALIGSVPVGTERLRDVAAPAGTGVSYAVISVRRSPLSGGNTCGVFGTTCVVSELSDPTPTIAIPAVEGGAPAPAPGAPPAPVPAPPAGQVPAPAPGGAPPPGPANGGPAPAPAAGPAMVLGERVAREAPPAGEAAPVAPDVSPHADTTEAAVPQPAVPDDGGAVSQAFRRLESVGADRTALVVTMVLLVLGAAGFYKGRHLLRSGR